MNDYIDFFDFSKPCPSSIKNCSELREHFLKLKTNLLKANCTTCNVQNLQVFFIKTFLNTEFANKVRKLNKLPKAFIRKDQCQEIRKIFYKNRIIDENVYICKNHIETYNPKINLLMKNKIIFRAKLGQYIILIGLNRKLPNNFMFSFLIINNAKNKLIYYKYARF